MPMRAKRHYDSIKPDDFAAWFLSFHEPMAAALKPNGSLVINIKDKVVDGVRHRYVWDTIKALERLARDRRLHLAEAERDAWLLANAAARRLGVLLSSLSQQAAVHRFRGGEEADRGLGHLAPGAAWAKRHDSAELGERERLRPQHLNMGQAQDGPPR
jgi:hypothetical protein